MLDRITRALFFGLSIAALGIIVSLLTPALKLEENAGLDWLFKLRGVRQPPDDVVLITIDKQSADILQLPNRPDKWPRSLHANLIQSLIKAGASVVAFDIIFDEYRIAEEDKKLATAINQAGNIVLFEYLKKKTIPINNNEAAAGEIISETLIPPIPEFAAGALALAPFPLPVVPVKVSQYWAFKTSAGDMPTLPVVAFQVHALQAYEDFLSLIALVRPQLVNKLPLNREQIMKSKQVGQLVLTLRQIFRQDGQLANELSESTKFTAFNFYNQTLIKAMIKLYQSDDNIYLNYYGPSRAITTIPYYQILEANVTGQAGTGLMNLRNKAVFVGFSEQLQFEQRDGFYSVFSQDTGLDLSGVEIIATAFANLLDGLPVKPLTMPVHFLLLLAWGVVIGITCRLSSAVIGIAAGVGLGIIYLAMASWLFSGAGLWMPLIVPLLIQLPVALFASTLMSFFISNKERQYIRKAFGYHLPEKVVNRLANNLSSIEDSSELAQGVCLVTDAEQYTHLSETMQPDKLGKLMNHYYETIFQPVKHYHGIVSDVVGDSMMAIWTEAKSDSDTRRQACEAALEINQAVGQFNAVNSDFRLPTRIGLHSGQIMLGHIGAIDHYEYRAVGDIVNTASRIQSLNKQLGTRILISEETIKDIDGFQTRKLGNFLLSGKSQPLVIYELMGLAHQTDHNQKMLCALFADAMNAFINREWQKADAKFQDIIAQYNDDKPAHYYLTLCNQYQNNEPDENWQGVISVYQK